MAFFKLRWPGRTEPSPAAKPAAGAPPPAESIEVMRRHARHRLIGAALLVLAGVVGFPLLFDTEPRPIAVDIPIEIPDRNKVVPLVVPEPVAQAPAASSTSSPSSEPVTVTPRPSPAAPHGATANGVVDAAQRPPGARSAAASATAVPRPLARHEAKPASEPKPPARTADAARALALLEGRSAEPVAAAGGDGRFIVQVGAFADADKVREVRTRVERAGIKTYTQVVETKEGKRTRVRVGPYASRAEADKVAARIRTLDLSAAILTL